jgi:hypothetical protein
LFDIIGRWRGWRNDGWRRWSDGWRWRRWSDGWRWRRHSTGLGWRDGWRCDCGWRRRDGGWKRRRRWLGPSRHDNTDNDTDDDQDHYNNHSNWWSALGCRWGGSGTAIEGI